MDQTKRFLLKAAQRDAQDRAYNAHLDLPMSVDLFQLEATLFNMLLAQQGWSYDGALSLHFQGEMGADGIGVLYISEHDNEASKPSEPTIAYFYLVLDQAGEVTLRTLPTDGITVGASMYLRKLLKLANTARRSLRDSR